MQIHTFRDDSEGEPGGYEQRTWVSLRLTPMEAENLRVALGDFLAQERQWEGGWHIHTRASDGNSEILLLPDREGTELEATSDERLHAWLSSLAKEGGSVATAVRVVAEWLQVTQEEAKEVVRQHPGWRDRFQSAE